MSAAAGIALQQVQREVHELRRTCRSLEDAVHLARGGAKRTADGLRTAQKRIEVAAERSVSPDDKAIPRRINEAVREVFTTADKVLGEQWSMICDLIARALGRASEELAAKEQRLRALELEASSQR